MDGLDNDNDGLVDYPADPGCSRPADNSELNIFEILKNLEQFLKDKFLDNLAVEQANRIAAPVLITAIVVNTFATFSFLNFLSYLQFFVTQPFAVLFRRKRQKWGVVYNALSKQPVDLAIVRLYRQEDGRLVQSRVTDNLGRYNFLAAPGRYYLTVTKPKFSFPSQYLKTAKEDAKYLDLYHGQTVEVTGEKASLTLNIPIDPAVQEKPVGKVIFQHYLRKVQYIAAFSAVPLAAVSMVINPGALTFALFGFHCLLYVLFRRLGYQKPPKSWGIIYDKDSRKPLALAVTRIYDKGYNKLLESRVTDAKGRYSFLVNNNVYYVSAEKLGYKQTRTEDIDLVSKDREAVVGMDIGLEKGKPGEAKLEPAPTPVALTPTLPPDKAGLPVKPAPAASKETAEPPLAQKVEDLGVGRESLEELLKTRESLAEVKEEIKEEKEELEQMAAKVREIEKTVEEKLEAVESEKPSPTAVKPEPTAEETEEAGSAPDSATNKDLPSADLPAEKAETKKPDQPPQKSIFG